MLRNCYNEHNAHYNPTSNESGSSRAYCSIYFYTPVNDCIKKYTDVKTLWDEMGRKDPDAKTSCLILKCYYDAGYSMTIDQLNLMASCQTTEMIL